jgi:hypothetical protein
MFVTPLKMAAVKIAYISYLYNFFHSNFSFNFALWIISAKLQKIWNFISKSKKSEGKRG